MGTGTFTFYNLKEAAEDRLSKKDLLRTVVRDRPLYLAYFLKLSFRLTLRLNTGWPALVSLLSRQK